MKQRVPTRDQRAQVEWKRQRVFWIFGTYRRLRHQVGIERLQIGISRLGEMCVGKRRIKMPSVAMNALAHRALEGGIGPCADAGFEIGRDVGRVDRAEWSLDRTAAATPIAAAQRAATVASAPRRLANGFCHLLLGAGGFGAANGTTLGAAACSPCNPLRIRSGVKGNSRNRTPVASKMALAMAAALGTEADSPTPSGGWSCRGSINKSILGRSGNLMRG